MKEELLRILEQYPSWAAGISLLLSILVAVAGLIPSVFITAANILFFGFWPGLLLSFIGEAIGAMVSFLLYRKGFKKMAGKSLSRFPKLQRLTGATGREAFMLIFSLRLLPFVPSGLVTFAAAIGNAGFVLFAVASSAGKVPALLLEGYSVYEVGRFGTQGKLILLLAGAGLLIYLLVKRNEKK